MNLHAYLFESLDRFDKEDFSYTDTTMCEFYSVNSC
jgi:hypothetical protein